MGLVLDVRAEEINVGHFIVIKPLHYVPVVPLHRLAARRAFRRFPAKRKDHAACSLQKWNLPLISASLIFSPILGVSSLLPPIIVSERMYASSRISLFGSSCSRTSIPGHTSS